MINNKKNLNYIILVLELNFSLRANDRASSEVSPTFTKTVVSTSPLNVTARKAWIRCSESNGLPKNEDSKLKKRRRICKQPGDRYP